MSLEKNQQVFFELVRAGLWEKEVRLSGYQEIDYSIIFQMAEEQSVVGLVAAGFDTLQYSERPPKEVALPFIGSTLQLEQRNRTMNVFCGKVD